MIPLRIELHNHHPNMEEDIEACEDTDGEKPAFMNDSFDLPKSSKGNQLSILQQVSPS